MTEAQQKFELAKKAGERGEQIRHKAKDEKRDLTKEEVQQITVAFEEYRNLKAEAEVIQEAERIKAEQESFGEVLKQPLFGEIKSDTSLASLEKKDLIPEGLYSDQKAFRTYLSYGLLPANSEGRKGLVLDKKIFGNEQDPELKSFGINAESTGGVLVSEQMASFIIAKRPQINVLRARCMVIPVTGPFGVPEFLDESDPAAIGEAGTFTETEVTPFGKVLLVPRKHGLLWLISEESVEDAPANESYLKNHFTNRCGVREEYLILNGTGGSSYPFGLLSATFNSVNDISGATDDINPDDFIEARFKLKPAYRQNAVYILPNLTMIKVAQFRTMEAGEGTGSFLWLPSFVLGQPDTILGKPALECESFADPSEDGDAMFLYGDLSTYLVAERTGISIQRLVERYSEYGKIGFRLYWRWDGTPTDAYAFTRYNRK